MRTKHLSTYPINFTGISEKSASERVFDDKSRDSYFRSLEVAQKNLSNSVKK